MELNRFFLIAGLIIGLAYIAVLIYCTLGDLLEFNHPKEKTVTKAFIKIAAFYFFISLIYIIGHIPQYKEVFKCLN